MTRPRGASAGTPTAPHGVLPPRDGPRTSVPPEKGSPVVRSTTGTQEIDSGSLASDLAIAQFSDEVTTLAPVASAISSTWAM